MGESNIDLIALRNALGGEISGGQVLCPGPGHSRRDRSLAVRLRDDGDFIVHSFTNDDWRVCKEYVRGRLGYGPWQPDPEVRPPRPQHNREDDQAMRNRQSARRIWDEAVDPHGTPVEDYLASRKLILPPELCVSVLRFHPACPWGTNGGRAACLIAPFLEFARDEVVAIHRIRVDQPEHWPHTDRMMLGAVRGTAIKLDPAADTLAVGEGVETCLAARQLGIKPVWCLGSARGIEYFAPLDGVENLIILGERDKDIWR